MNGPHCHEGANAFIEQHFGDCVYDWRDLVGFCLGLFCILLWVVSQLPQFISNVRNQSAEALSVFFLAELFCGDTLNLLGCLVQGQQLATTTYLAMYFVLSDMVMLMQFMYYGALKVRRDRLASAIKKASSRSAARPALHHHQHLTNHQQEHHHHHHHTEQDQLQMLPADSIGLGSGRQQQPKATGAASGPAGLPATSAGVAILATAMSIVTLTALVASSRRAGPGGLPERLGGRTPERVLLWHDPIWAGGPEGHSSISGSPAAVDSLLLPQWLVNPNPQWVIIAGTAFGAGVRESNTHTHTQHNTHNTTHTLTHNTHTHNTTQHTHTSTCNSLPPMHPHAPVTRPLQ